MNKVILSFALIIGLSASALAESSGEPLSSTMSAKERIGELRGWITDFVENGNPRTGKKFRQASRWSRDKHVMESIIFKGDTMVISYSKEALYPKGHHVMSHMLVREFTVRLADLDFQSASGRKDGHPGGIECKKQKYCVGEETVRITFGIGDLTNQKADLGALTLWMDDPVSEAKLVAAFHQLGRLRGT